MKMIKSKIIGFCLVDQLEKKIFFWLEEAAKYLSKFPYKDKKKQTTNKQTKTNKQTTDPYNWYYKKYLNKNF